jgi:hypothetical protein
MPKFHADLSNLDNVLNKKFHKVAKDKLQAFAFDVVRLPELDNGANLWEVKSCEDGDYIVALYEEPAEGTKKTASSLNWDVSLSKTAKALDVFYKGDPIIRLAAKDIGVPENELSFVPSYLPSKLSSNKKLVQALLAKLLIPAKNEVLKKHPELI